jgi:hypothetical protein
MGKEQRLPLRNSSERLELVENRIDVKPYSLGRDDQHASRLSV